MDSQVSYNKVSYKDAFLNLIYPEDDICVLCGRNISQDEKSMSRWGLCSDCTSDIHIISGKTCCQCGRSIYRGDICEECSYSPRIFDRTVAFARYDDALKNMIFALKYSRKTYLAKPLAEMMSEKILNTMWTEDMDLIVPVPLNLARKNQRVRN